MLILFATLVVFLPIRVPPHDNLWCIALTSSCTKPLPHPGARVVSNDAKFDDPASATVRLLIVDSLP